jgi:hypothetical protein
VTPTADLYTVFSAITTLVHSPKTEQLADYAKERREVIPNLDIPLLARLQRHVAHAALKKLGSELQLSRRNNFLVACSCIVRQTMGLPCGHALARWHRAGVPVPLSAIHQHWRFEIEAEEEEEPVAEIPAMLDPIRGVRRQRSIQTSGAR